MVMEGASKTAHRESHGERATLDATEKDSRQGSGENQVGDKELSTQEVVAACPGRQDSQSSAMPDSTHGHCCDHGTEDSTEEKKEKDITPLMAATVSDDGEVNPSSMIFAVLLSVFH